MLLLSTKRKQGGYMEKPNIMWYEDDKLAIEFNSMPHVCVRYITPSMTQDEVKSIKKYPFICKTELKVKLFDHEKEEVYMFTIPKGYCYDGASINRIFWRLIGAPTDNTFLIASLLHDTMCEHHEYINNDRYFSTIVFERLLYVAGVNPLKRWVMKHAVDNFQKFCKWQKGG